MVGQELNKATPEKLTFLAGAPRRLLAGGGGAGRRAREENGGYALFRGISVNDLTAYQAARA